MDVVMLCAWAFWNIFVPIVVPVGLVWLYFLIVAQRRKIYEIIRDGQICLVCIILAAGTWFDISQEGNQLNPTDEAIKDGAIALLFLILIVSFAIYFAAIRSNANMTAEVERNIGRASAFTLAFTAVAVIYCRAHFRLIK